MQKEKIMSCLVSNFLMQQKYHNFATKASEIRYPIGRVKNETGVAWPFPVGIVVFRPGF